MAKVYEIWMEGYVVQEGRGKAREVGIADGKTFKEACMRYARFDRSFKKYFDEEKLSYWGCRLFDNEVDTRRNFG